MIKYILYLFYFFICSIGTAELNTLGDIQIREEENSQPFRLVLDDFYDWKNDFFNPAEKESNVYSLLDNSNIPVNKIVENLQSLEKTGNDCAARALAGIYLQGTQVPYNRVEALNILQKAATRGDRIAKRITGQLLLDPQYTDYSPQIAFSYLQEAKEGGDEEAGAFLAVTRILGLHPQKNSVAGLQELTALSKKGNPLARMYLLLTNRALLMQAGKDTEKMDAEMNQLASSSSRLTYIAALNQSGERRKECLEKLAKANHPLGIILKAKYYIEAGDWNMGAFMLSKPPVDKIPEAQNQLGGFLFLCFMNQPDPDLKEHLGREFISLFQAASVQHHQRSEYRLASLLIFAGPSFIKNYSDQEKLWMLEILKRAARTGDAEALNNYGYQYLIGFYTKKDLKEGEKWLLKSAEKNYAPALTNLALLYSGELNDEAGEAIPIDYEKSIELLERAKKLGDADAQRQIDYLKEISLKQNNEIPEN